MKRVIRFLGNRTEPEAELYAKGDEPAPFSKIQTSVFIPEKKKVRKRKDRERFDVNLAEALTGWKAWILVGDFLSSPVFTENRLRPGEPMVASCGDGYRHLCPNARCGCGIYAADDYWNIVEFNEPNAVAAEVLGWGRYVRAMHGWRAQFCYPAKLLINRDSIHLLPALMRYHVPIYCWEPSRIYNPRDDGYEHWKNEENWNFRTAPEPDADED